MKIKVEIDEHVRECDHCGAKNIKRTFRIIYFEQGIEVFVGRVCIQNITNINTSGNPYKAREKIEIYLNSLEDEELLSLLDFENDGA